MFPYDQTYDQSKCHSLKTVYLTKNTTNVMLLSK